MGGSRGMDPSNPDPSTQADVSSHQDDAASHQDDDDGQQAERVPGNGAMGGGDQGVGGGHDSAVLPLMGGGAGGGANALVEAALGDALAGLGNNEEEQLPPSDSEADE